MSRSLLDLEKPAGKKRRELERWFSGPEGPQALFAGRLLPNRDGFMERLNKKEEVS